MDAGISGMREQEVRLASRHRALEAITRYRPMSIWGQLIVLGFLATMVLLVAFTSLFAHAPNPALFLSGSLLFAIFFVAMNAIRTQRQVNALVDLVTQNFDKS